MTPEARAGGTNRPARRAGETVGVFLKLIFTKIVEYLEVCALPYLAGIASAVAFELTIPAGLWKAFEAIGVIVTVALLYAPIAILHAAHIRNLKKRRTDASILFFLEDGLFEHRNTLGLAVMAAVLSFVFGIVNYNFAVDTSDPHHLARYVVKPWESNPVALEGKIIREPEFRDFNVWLYIQPTVVDRQPVSKGLVLVKVARTVEGFEDFEYGQYVRVRGQLREPDPATNPGGFDYKRHLNNRNIFAVMSVNKTENIEDLGRKESNALFDVSLWVKKRFLAIMKQTLPYPQSSFQGAIIYGLRVGVPQEQLFEFKWAGMSWLLVVAGAHLLMVYLTLKMILESVRPNPKLAFCALFVLLMIFLILTGINPPTVRAFIMIMLYEFTRVFLGQDVRAAVRSAIGIAAYLLLASHFFPFFSPLIIFEPTVTLSFGAVLSLVYLSRPIEHLLRRHCYGLTSVVILAGLATSLTAMSVLRPPTMSVLAAQQAPIWITMIVLAALTCRLNNRYRGQYRFDQIYLGYNDASMFQGWRRWIHPTFLTYNRLPGWILAFAGAQVAIQFGMMLPLSSWYFQRSPVGGFLANVIAFPTLGVIIQVGLIAVLAGMIPVIGLKLAFLLNAADFLGIQLLMKLAHYSKVVFPYPMAMKPTGLQILLYYLILFGLILYDRIFYAGPQGYLTLKEVLDQKVILTKRPVYARIRSWLATPRRKQLFAAASIFICGSMAMGMARGRTLDHLKVVVLELADGSGTIIETPGGRRILVDAGKVDSRGMFDVGERTVAPILLAEQIERLDAVVVTSLKPSNIGGMPFILENFTVGAVLVPFDPAVFLGEDTFTSKIYARLGGYSSGGSGTKHAIETVERMRGIVRERHIPVARIKAGDVLLRGGGIDIDVLNPDSEPVETDENVMGNNCAVLRLKFGPNTLILGGDIDAEGEANVLKELGPDARASFVLIPSHGSADAGDDSFIAAIRPAHAAVQYKAPPWRRAEEGKDPVTVILQKYANAGSQVYRTDLMGAIMAEAWPDGRFSVTPALATPIPDITEQTESDTDVEERSALKSEGAGL